ncbi:MULTISPECIES: hypothetical protein [unclassified Paenibacillus]|uniref:hypothetical protein n=1 Tax=unclassified Paenibacillus TaxID=185978 RepID=UPI001AE54AD9|nr:MULTISPECIES: hypothetical protein [unclassified Paenibacillus]MBP1157673.1 hypothetical protein [Paenibacillus sp. PvP091]MBP1171590.1 hypothetical protein [Paenibacillus sp. PvR098]MBP2437971.1 hypothetical protein [Paenibacillus sp. PvP052]
MTNNNQKTYDSILSKIRANYEDVSLAELKRISEIICSRYTGSDIILSQLSNKELMGNMDYFSRSYFELVNYKKVWGSGSKHYILSSLFKSSYGLSSESRKRIFAEKELFIEQDNVGYGNRSGFAHFKFFVRGKIPYLFLVHEYGYNSITNKIEELVTTIENEFLHDIGFDIIKDEVQIFYKDVGEHYDQVTLQLEMKNPKWRSLEMHEQLWFDQTWDSIGLGGEEPGRNTYFFEKGKQFDAYKTIMEIFVNVKKELFIVDNYVDSSLFLMLDIVKSSASIKLLTSKMHGDASIAVDKFKAQRGNFDWCKAKDFHDRYLIADNDCYLLGASIKDFANKATTLVAIKEKEVIKVIKTYALNMFQENLAKNAGE